MANMPMVNTAAGPMVAPANCVPVCAPSKEMLTPGRFSVNDLDKMEAITQSLYSYQTYPAAGAQNFVFFQVPVSGVVTREDTNMVLAGQLPAPQKFLVQGIGIDLLSGLKVSTLGADTANSQPNDLFEVLRRGVFTLTIGSKPYLTMAPLMELPPRAALGGFAAVTSQTTAAANLQTIIATAHSEGEVFTPTPLLLEAGQNFIVEIGFPGGAVALPSTNATTRIGVQLYGTLYRPPQ